jgi:transposase
LSAADGQSNNAISKDLRISRPTILLWRERFKKLGPAGIGEDASHGWSSRRTDEATVKKIIDRTLQTYPPDATHWSTRTMAKAVGVSHATVARVWEAHGLQPHRMETFKLSKDKHFVEKLTDAVGLYLNPPDKALVLCVDEQSQIQALDRTQPGLPMKKGRRGTMTHDYERNGTTCLFAALNMLDSTIIGTCYPRHRHEEFLKFLQMIHRSTPRRRDLHLILDNYRTHTHPIIKEWLAKHPRFHLHFTPTSASWLNMIERWFGELTRKRIRRGTFASVAELIRAISEYTQIHNQEPKPFVWVKKVDQILAKIAKIDHCKPVIETLH